MSTLRKSESRKSACHTPGSVLQELHYSWCARIISAHPLCSTQSASFRVLVTSLATPFWSAALLWEARKALLLHVVKDLPKNIIHLHFIQQTPAL